MSTDAPNLNTSDSSAEDISNVFAAAGDAQQNGVERLKQIPVMVSVRLAEKKIQVDQLMTMSPGALVMFDKSCEAPLDLYINNARYCRGEAVKIGENFGLKIDEINPGDDDE